MVPQRHPLGEEDDVDLGTISVYLAGALSKLQPFIMRRSASGRAFPRAYLSECQEVFLDGHVCLAANMPCSSSTSSAERACRISSAPIASRASRRIAL
jgi:hypothetical protein